MRVRLILLVVATTSLVLVAFLLPLGLLVRTVTADRAINGAVTRAQSVTPLVATLDGGSLGEVVRQLNAQVPDTPMTVFLAGGETVTVIDSQRGWLRVRDDQGRTGWIYADGVKRG